MLDGLTLTASRGGRKRRDATRTHGQREREREEIYGDQKL